VTQSSFGNHRKPAPLPLTNTPPERGVEKQIKYRGRACFFRLLRNMATLHSTCLHGESFNIRKRKNQSKLSTTEKGIQDGRREEKSFNTRIE